MSDRGHYKDNYRDRDGYRDIHTEPHGQLTLASLAPSLCARLPLEVWVRIALYVAAVKNPPSGCHNEILCSPQRAFSTQHSLYCMALVSPTLSAVAVPQIWRRPWVQSMHSAVALYRAVVCYPSTVPAHSVLQTAAHDRISLYRHNQSSQKNKSMGLSMTADTTITPALISCVGPYSARGVFLLSLVHSLSGIAPDYSSLLHMMLDKCYNLQHIPSFLWTQPWSDLVLLISQRIPSLRTLSMTSTNCDALGELAKTIDLAGREWYGGMRSSSATTPDIMNIPLVRDLLSSLLPSDRKMASLFSHFKNLQMLALHDDAITTSTETVLHIATYLHPKLKVIKLSNGLTRRITTSSIAYIQKICPALWHLFISRMTFCLPFLSLPFNSLRKLELVDCEFHAGHVVHNLVSVCPSLVSFVIRNCTIRLEGSCLDKGVWFETLMRSFTSNNIKSLEMSCCVFKISQAIHPPSMLAESTTYKICITVDAVLALFAVAPRLLHIILVDFICDPRVLLALTRSQSGLYTLDIRTFTGLTSAMVSDIIAPLTRTRFLSLLFVVEPTVDLSFDPILAMLASRLNHCLQCLALSGNYHDHSLDALKSASTVPGGISTPNLANCRQSISDIICRYNFSPLFEDNDEFEY
ncbi:hypothetical protein BASA60_011209 [Batrachochytrium salamandrivorans]|nr:hypothetical protein BASA60_011209 [Batrachochytrium salamandrivorans]KAH6571845.1 hypothetical protein BASA62_003680 [Batrachochytrium salamandrivorans]